MGLRAGQPSDIKPTFQSPDQVEAIQVAPVAPVVTREPATQPQDEESALRAELAQLQAPQPQQAQPVSPPGIQTSEEIALRKELAQLESGDEGAGLLARFKSSFGRNLKESKTILEKSAFGKGNVKIKKGELFFRKDKKSPFKLVDPSDDFSLSDLAGDIADVGGDALEIATSIAGEIGLAPFITPAGGAVAGAAIGVNVRDQIVDQLFNAKDEDIDLMSETLKSSGFALGGFGVTKVLSKGWSVLKTATQKFKGGNQLERIKALADVNIVLDDVIKSVNNGKTVSASQVGQTLDDALTIKKKALEIAVSTQEDAAVAKAGDGFFSSTGMLNQIKQALEEQGVKFDKDGFIKQFKPATALPDTPVVSPGEVTLQEFERVASGSRAREKAIEELSESARLTSAFKGNRGKQQAMAETVKTYNSFLASTRNNQGVDLRTMLDSIKKFQEFAFRKEEFGSSVRGIMKKIEHAGIQDRHSALSNVLDGDSKKIIDRAYSVFSDSIDKIMDITGSIGRKESPEMFAKAVIQKGNSRRVKDLKFIVGEDSEAFRRVKASWITDITKKSSESGVLFGRQFMKEINSFGDDVVKEMLSPAELGKIKTLAKRSERIFKADLLNEADKTAVQDMALTFIPQTFLAARIKAFANLFGGKKAGDYLLDEGFMQIMRRTKSNAERLKIMELQQTLVKIAVQKGVTPNRSIPKVLQDNVVDFLTNNGVETTTAKSLSNQVLGFGGKKLIAPEPQTVDLPSLNIEGEGRF